MLLILVGIETVIIVLAYLIYVTAIIDCGNPWNVINDVASLLDSSDTQYGATVQYNSVLD